MKTLFFIIENPSEISHDLEFNTIYEDSDFEETEELEVYEGEVYGLREKMQNKNKKDKAA